jgi:hypothetical protein
MEVAKFLAVLLSTPLTNAMPFKMQERHLTLCVCSILRHHFVSDQTVLIANTEDADFMNLLLMKVQDMSDWPLQVFRQSPTMPSDGDRRKIGNYVIVSRGHADVEEQTDRLKQSAAWNSQARFLVVVTLPVATPGQQALSVVKEMWDNARALNVVVLVQLDAVFHLYTWFPYQSYQHCDSITDVVLINQWSLDGEGRFMSDRLLYPNKFPNNFHGCPLKISVPHYGILEVPYVIAFCKFHNLTAVIQFKHENDRFPSEAIRESLEDLLFGLSEGVIGGIPLIMEATQFGEPSLPYFESKYIWYVPCSRPLPRLLAISRIFSVSLWVAVLVAMLLVPVAMWCLSSCSPAGHSHETITHVFYNMWAVSLGVSVTKMPRALRLRVLILPWICYCLAVSTVFQTFLTSYLVDPGLEEQVTSLQELLQSGMEFGFRDEITELYRDSHFDIHKQVLKGRQNCNKTHLCIQRIIDFGDYATIAESWSVENELRLMNNSNRVCLMNDIESFPIQIVAYFSKGSVLVNTFNRMITSLVETGIILKAVNEVKARPVAGRIGDGEARGGYFVFTPSHLQVAFYALVLGHSLSFVLFLLELLYHRLDTVSGELASG